MHDIFAAVSVEPHEKSNFLTFWQQNCVLPPQFVGGRSRTASIQDLEVDEMDVHRMVHACCTEKYVILQMPDLNIAKRGCEVNPIWIELLSIDNPFNGRQEVRID